MIPEGLGLAPAEDLARTAKEKASRGHAGGVPDIDGIESGPAVGREEGEPGAVALQDGRQGVVFAAGYVEIGFRRIAEGPPLSPDMGLVDPGFPGVFQENGLERSDLGGRAKDRELICQAGLLSTVEQPSYPGRGSA
jgi:hypothetical protein